MVWWYHHVRTATATAISTATDADSRGARSRATIAPRTTRTEGQQHDQLPGRTVGPARCCPPFRRSHWPGHRRGPMWSATAATNSTDRPAANSTSNRAGAQTCHPATLIGSPADLRVASSPCAAYIITKQETMRWRCRSSMNSTTPRSVVVPPVAQGTGVGGRCRRPRGDRRLTRRRPQSRSRTAGPEGQPEGSGGGLDRQHQRCARPWTTRATRATFSTSPPGGAVGGGGPTRADRAHHPRRQRGLRGVRRHRYHGRNTAGDLRPKLAPVAIIRGDNSPDAGEVIACPSLDTEVRAGDWTSMIGRPEELAAQGMKVGRASATSPHRWRPALQGPGLRPGVQR